MSRVVGDRGAGEGAGLRAWPVPACAPRRRRRSRPRGVAGLPEDVAVVILTPSAAQALARTCRCTTRLTVVMPCVTSSPQHRRRRELAPVREALLRRRAHGRRGGRAGRGGRGDAADTGADRERSGDPAAGRSARAQGRRRPGPRGRPSARACCARPAPSQLQARRATYDALISAAAAAVRDELADDREVVSALGERARAALGADAVLSRLPDGGLVAEAGGRRLVLPLQALVERVVAELVATEGRRDVTTTETAAGVVVRVNGPLVEVEGLAGVAMFEMVDLGPNRLPAEVVSLRDEVLTLQAYEYTGGLATR